MQRKAHNAESLRFTADVLNDLLGHINFIQETSIKNSIDASQIEVQAKVISSFETVIKLVQTQADLLEKTLKESDEK
jgi:hypothetical protein